MTNNHARLSGTDPASPAERKDRDNWCSPACCHSRADSHHLNDTRVGLNPFLFTPELLRRQSLICRDVNRLLSESDLSPDALSPCWSYGWFCWFDQKTKRGWVGIFLWPQWLINNPLSAPPGDLAEADELQVRRTQLERMEKTFGTVGEKKQQGHCSTFLRTGFV